MWSRPLGQLDDIPDRRPASARPRRPATPVPARRRGWRPDPVAPLEGRALLAATPFDPTFGIGGAIIGASAPVDDSATPAASVAALALQGDGKIVTAEVATPAGPITTLDPLVIRRYYANGALDTTFGTGGQAVVPFLPPVTPGGGSATTSTFAIKAAPTNLAIQADGTILVAAEATTGTDSDGAATVQDVVARLTNTGALDGSFGTSGEFVLPTSITGVRSVAVEAGGRVLVAGVLAGDSGSTTAAPVPVVVGLTAAGALDTTFGTDGQVAVPLAADPIPPGPATIQATELAVTGAGQILLGVTAASSAIEGSTLSRLTADGAIDTTLGANKSGTVDLSNSIAIDTLLPQADGKILLAGAYTPPPSAGAYRTFADLARLNADGSTDASFHFTSNPLNSAFNFAAAAVDPAGRIVAVAGADVYRFLSDGTFDPTFGIGGHINVSFNNSTPFGPDPFTAASLALTTSGDVLLGGQLRSFAPTNVTFASAALAQIRPARQAQATNDYDGDGRSDPAAELATFGAFASRTSKGDTVQPFGPTGAGQAIPAPGDYDGDGRADVAAYLPAFGVLAYRPSSGGADVLTAFGPAGPGNAIPAAGDYDGDGKSDVALYLPGSGAFVIDPSSGAAPYAVTFGPAGAGNSVPAPGDYDGDGRTDLALYLPAFGVFAIDPSGGGSPHAVSFGAAGAGNSIPAPGDYDGDGRTDIAAYLPQYGVFAYRPSTSNEADVLTTFGPAGTGAAIPVPGDYDGDGRTDIALYLPGNAVFAIDPSGGAAPYAQQFGAAGAGSTIPATAVVIGQGTVSATALPDPGTPGADASVPVYLPADLPGTNKKKV